MGQYKLHIDQLKKEISEEKDNTELNDLIEEANKQIEDFNAEKHLIKAKIKSLLIEYCDLNEDSYVIGDEIDMDEYLEKLEKELKIFTSRVKEESMDKIGKIMIDLETVQRERGSLGDEIEKVKQENQELKDLNQQLEDTVNELTGNKQVVEDRLNNLEVEFITKEAEIDELKQKLDEVEVDEFDNQEEEIDELKELVLKYQEEAIKVSEKLKFTEKELQDEQERNRKLKSETSDKNPKAIETSRESEEGKEYLERVDIIEERVDQIKNEIGKVMVESFDTLKQHYEAKHKEYVKKVQDKLIESEIKEKGILNILKELKGIMNDSIRVLKCITHEDKVWFLVEEDFEVDISREDPQQYWIKESDLSAEEKEYIHQFTPTSGMRENDDTEEYTEINRNLKAYKKQLKELREERKDLLKELREIRFGLKITYYCMNNSFDEDTEQKLHDYDIKFIEYEDDITYLTENLQEQKILVNELEIKTKKQERRIEELNGVIANISRGTNESVERFLNSYKKTNELMHKNQELRDEVNSKNEEIESLKGGGSSVGKVHEFSPKLEDEKSEEIGKFQFKFNC